MMVVIIAAATILPGLKQVRAPSVVSHDVETGPDTLGAGGIASLGGSSNGGGDANSTMTSGANETAEAANATNTG